ncbi:hypothetical protein J6590_028556 [Homalodisca vitripennis]|nr:hypothetical protein J6590_028556 [Homalodisca vitripennis]
MKADSEKRHCAAVSGTAARATVFNNEPLPQRDQRRSKIGVIGVPGESEHETADRFGQVDCNSRACEFTRTHMDSQGVSELAPECLGLPPSSSRNVHADMLSMSVDQSVVV